MYVSSMVNGNKQAAGSLGVTVWLQVKKDKKTKNSMDNKINKVRNKKKQN